MKHGILLIAYHNLNHIIRFVNKLDNDFRVFIHWDKRNLLTENERNLLMQSGIVVYIGQEYVVNWASFGIVRATLKLCKEATKYRDLDYLHLISDADYLSTDLQTMKRFFIEHQGKNYMEYEAFPVKNWYGGGYDRIRYFHRLEELNIRVNSKDNKIYFKEIEEQKSLGTVRSLPALKLYGGSAWWSLTTECVQYLISQEPIIEQYFIDTMFPDEAFAQTIIMNNDIFGKTVVNDNKRYIYWPAKHGSSPAILDEDDFVNIITSNSIFARKVDPIISEKLIVAIDSTIIKKGCYVKCDNLNVAIKNVKTLLNINSQGGLFVGKAGALIFLNELLKLGLIGKDIIISTLQQVLGEFDQIEDDSYESGRLGIVVCLEHIFETFSSIYTQEAIKDLNKINSIIINGILNFTGNSISAYTHKIYRIYFTARKLSYRITNADLTAIKQLENFVIEPYNKEIYTSFRFHTCGLLGYAGIGLELLKKEYLQEITEWNYLIS